MLDYYTFGSSGFTKVSAFNADTVLNEGISMSDVATISEMQWDTFFDADNGDKGIAIAFAMSMTDITDVAYLDNLSVTADMRGEWRKAVHGADYDYAYPNNEVLKVELSADGNYKINYAISTSSGGGLDTGVPIGTVISFMGNTPPDDYLSCDGNVYRINDYKPLANFIHLQFGSYDYFGGDGIDTFAVPDLRGEFLRGTGASGYAHAGAGASVGVHQNPTEHVRFASFSGGDGFYTRYENTKSFPRVVYADWNNVTNAGSYKSQQLNTSLVTTSDPRGSQYVSRPTNTSVLYCIKYK